MLPVRLCYDVLSVGLSVLTAADVTAAVSVCLSGWYAAVVLLLIHGLSFVKGSEKACVLIL